MSDDEKVTTCDQCGRTMLCRFVADPYASEIHGDETLHWLCDSCLRELAREV